MAHATDEDGAVWKRSASLLLRGPSSKRSCATSDGGQGLSSSVSTGQSLIRSVVFGCEEGADEESFTGDGPSLKPAGAKGSGTVDGRCVAEADAIVAA